MSKTVKTVSVKRPQKGLTAAMWSVFDSATAPILPQHARTLAAQEGWNVSLTQSHLRQWKRASGRVTH